MQRMFNLRKWTQVNEGSALAFASERARVVRMEVNSIDEVALHIRYPDGVFEKELGAPGEAATVNELIPPGAMYFLGLVKGRDTIETFVEGKFDLLPEGGSVSVYTADGDTVHGVVEDPVIFTRIAERKARNPELEAIERRMYLNQERRLQQQMDDMERRYGAILTAAEERARNAERKAQRAAPAAAAAAVSGGDEPTGKPAPKPDAGTGTDDKSASEAGGGASGKAGKAGKG